MDCTEVYWLLDSRFDFLLPSFLKEFGIEKKDMVLVNSYHSSLRDDWNKIYIPFEKKQTVVQMEPDDMNQIFSENLKMDGKKIIISFSGAGLPQSDDFIYMTATGEVAEKCNDKWWQYCQFTANHILTPKTYQFHEFGEVERQYGELINKHKKIIIKKPSLSGGYQMAVLSSESDLKAYRDCIKDYDKRQDFLVSEYISHKQSFASMGIVRKDGEVVFIPAVTEQVLYRGVEYEGLLFPAFLKEEYREKIQHKTEKIGEILAKNGYFGFYNVDYILGADGQLYAAEINARWAFGTILAACLYGEHFWKIMQGICIKEMKCPKKRLAIGKVKAKQGRKYVGMESCSNITEWFKKKEGGFKTFFCGTDEEEIFEYGSYIGIFGEFFSGADDRETILNMFWRRCIEYYK